MLNDQTPLRAARCYEQQQASDISPEDRPLFHLTPMVGWMNDPNGFCFYGGCYHLFYQYHPYNTVWGPMHWGHATSSDLLHWNYKPVALAPDTDADAGGCFSGSATATPDGQMLLMYTGVVPQPAGHKELQTQCIALGDGLQFQKAEINPVLSAKDLPAGYSVHDFRDPKIWREDDRYYCVVANRHETRQGAILLFSAPDALHWEFLAELDASHDQYGKMWECPDFFPLDEEQVLLTSPQEMQATADGEFHAGFNTVALLGHYDKAQHKFRRKTVQTLDSGFDFYAPQSVLAPDGRRIIIGWEENWETCNGKTRAHPWFGQMSLPRELSIKNGRLCQNPIRELETLRCESETLQVALDGEMSWPFLRGRALDVTLKVPVVQATGRLFRVRLAQQGALYTEILCDLEQGTLLFDRSHSGSRRDIAHIRSMKAAPRDGVLSLRIIVDKESVELFINDGERVATALIETPLEADGFSLSSDAAMVVHIEKHTLRA